MQQDQRGGVGWAAGHDEGFPLAGLDAQLLVGDRPGVQQFAVPAHNQTRALFGGVDVTHDVFSSSTQTSLSSSALPAGPPTMIIFIVARTLS